MLKTEMMSNLETQLCNKIVFIGVKHSGVHLLICVCSSYSIAIIIVIFLYYNIKFASVTLKKIFFIYFKRSATPINDKIQLNLQLHDITLLKYLEIV